MQIWDSYYITPLGLALLAGSGGFLGFYVSEVAKKSLRARHVSYQAYGYVTGVRNTLLTGVNIKDFQPFINRWAKARRCLASAISSANDRHGEFLNLDRRQLGRISVRLGSRGGREKLHGYLKYLVDNPGINSAQMIASERMLHGIDSWKETLPDSDVVLLGPEVLSHYLQYRSAMLNAGVGHLQICVCIKDTPPGGSYEVNYLLGRLDSVVASFIRAQVELDMLIPLVQKSMSRNLFQLFSNLFRKSKS